MTTAAPTCDHQWMNRSSICLVCGKQGDDEAERCQHQWVNRSTMGDPWRECSLCGKQEDAEQ